MKREELEHLVRAAGGLLDELEVLVLGSQAILGSVPDGLPRRAALSIEADLAAMVDPTQQKAMMIAGNLGEDSRFHNTFGYYADGVDVSLPRLPRGWRERLVPLRTENTNGVTAWCLDPHDLCASKLLAGRAKDIEYVRALLVSGHVRPETLLERIGVTDATTGEQRRIGEQLAGMRRPGRRSAFRRALRNFVASREDALPTTPPNSARPTPSTEGQSRTRTSRPR